MGKGKGPVLCRAKPENQAARAIRACHRAGLIASVGTYRVYEDALTQYGKYIGEHWRDGRRADLIHVTVAQAKAYIDERKGDLSQKTLDCHRQALACYLKSQGKLAKDERLPRVQSTRETRLECRAYTREQISEIAAHQNERNGLATLIAANGGLRAHELLTIRRPDEGKPVDVRHYADGREKSLPGKWQGREKDTASYIVTGKGGLVREVRLSADLARRLEERRLPEPVTVIDRTVIYPEVRYDIGGGKSWSSSFSAASTRVLGWSHGAHGVRHSYAQERMKVLTCKYDEKYARTVTSQEMGHFRDTVTLAYLR